MVGEEDRGLLGSGITMMKKNVFWGEEGGEEFGVAFCEARSWQLGYHFET